MVPNLYSVWVMQVVDCLNWHWMCQDSCYVGSWASCGYLHIWTLVSTIGRGGIPLSLPCISSHYISLRMLNRLCNQLELHQRNGYDCGVLLMADMQAIYSGHLAVPMRLDVDGFHADVHQKILSLPHEGNALPSTFALLGKDKRKIIRQRAEAACQQYPIDDATYGTNSFPFPPSNLRRVECTYID